MQGYEKFPDRLPSAPPPPYGSHLSPPGMPPMQSQPQTHIPMPAVISQVHVRREPPRNECCCCCCSCPFWVCCLFILMLNELTLQLILIIIMQGYDKFTNEGAPPSHSFASPPPYSPPPPPPQQTQPGMEYFRQEPSAYPQPTIIPMQSSMVSNVHVGGNIAQRECCCCCCTCPFWVCCLCFLLIIGIPIAVVLSLGY